MFSSLSYFSVCSHSVYFFDLYFFVSTSIGIFYIIFYNHPLHFVFYSPSTFSELLSFLKERWLPTLANLHCLRCSYSLLTPSHPPDLLPLLYHLLQPCAIWSSLTPLSTSDPLPAHQQLFFFLRLSMSTPKSLCLYCQSLVQSLIITNLEKFSGLLMHLVSTLAQLNPSSTMLQESFLKSTETTRSYPALLPTFLTFTVTPRGEFVFVIFFQFTGRKISFNMKSCG